MASDCEAKKKFLVIQTEIRSPSLVKVKPQYHENDVKILFIAENGNQTLVTYDTQGNPECTVQDLLRVTDIPELPLTQTAVFFPKKNDMDIDIVVKVGDHSNKLQRSISPEF